MSQFITPTQKKLVSRFRQIYATYQENRDLVSVGAYQAGSNPQLDEAIALWPAIIDFLRQPEGAKIDAKSSLQQLRELFDVVEAEDDETP